MVVMYSIIFSWSAQEDLNDIMDEYDSKKFKGGLEFFAKLDKVVVLLEQNPYVYADRILHFKRAFITDSPYILFYQIIQKDKDVEILAIIHNKRGNDLLNENSI